MKLDSLVRRRLDGGGLDRAERYYFRSRDVHPLLEVWEERYPDRYRLYVLYRDWLLEEEKLDLLDLEVHAVAVAMALGDDFEVCAARAGLSMLDFDETQMKAAVLVQKYRDMSRRVIKDGKRGVRAKSSLDGLGVRMEVAKLRIMELEVSPGDGSESYKRIIDTSYEVED